ncbi:hypothetical protein PRIPAC_74638 [Pristionchus pacificus]|uniref:Uncharacterized protein n=1 Tax=Pristionchus pacificus TaxID=54126 RepID=A0A2A6C8P6_PRIPA|nr:hypothetical protein PRIPAC_74638 [Pristionchus pacificus]|eukprot:PDM74585.1 hypothetical protein PRIPAC_41941 [Pristionchus pacificus]
MSHADCDVHAFLFTVWNKMGGVNRFASFSSSYANTLKITWMKEQPTQMSTASAPSSRNPSQCVPEVRPPTLKNKNGLSRPDFRLCSPLRRQTTEKKSKMRMSTWTLIFDAQSSDSEQDQQGVEQYGDERETTDDACAFLEKEENQRSATTHWLIKVNPANQSIIEQCSLFRMPDNLM